MLLIAQIGRDSHGCGNDGRGTSGCVSHKLARPKFFEPDYLMATAFTSLNVVWPSKTF